MGERRCTFKCGNWNCGSYQFNLYKDDIDQGDLCDVHYWQTKAQAQPEQEPVAWAVYYKGGGSKSLHWPENHSPDGDATKFDAVPLYAAPPQRPWAGLEAEDRLCAKYMQDAPDGIEAVIDYIEDKLKEKNT
jgi:hypothetical protein